MKDLVMSYLRILALLRLERLRKTVKNFSHKDSNRVSEILTTTFTTTPTGSLKFTRNMLPLKIRALHPLLETGWGNRNCQ
jgi:hypothetical protein